MAKSGKTQFAVLGMLALLKESSGYDLKKHMQSSTEYFWKETFSSIYPVLEELEKQELIIKIDKPLKNDRKRNMYTLTSKGYTVLENWLIQPPERIQLRNDLLLKLFFGTMVPIEVTIEHLKKYKHELQTRLALYQEIQNQLNSPNTGSLRSLYESITLDHGIRQASSALEWCTNALKKLKLAKNQNLEI